ncbi:glycoside hydrolase family 88/105 protein [Paenibacillus methanolicus]|uniref:Unsaturated rhamnogalacturonyl hydrolase n=1 Tax=Paenibacillus methanolicus TaxID=582686 RepID=A0A5S5CL76_9BACL|nr:glycoside hydrolase family 88 protein [Paenibacillus methanolicus]TYP79281.1 unsaturated rhamnogalacturonyl hydrolase [Paenibacillus methanolicus]
MNAKTVELLRKVAAYTMNADERNLEQNWTTSRLREWQWGQGVALYGLVQTYEALQDDGVIAFIRRWVDAHLDAGVIGKSINTTAPLLAVIKLWELTGETRYAAICDEFADWCLAEAPRADEGAFEHSCTENAYPQEIWADTLFMGGIFLARWGVLRQRQAYVKEAARQFILHYRYLADDRSGLIHHGYYGKERARKGVLWGRGNGWFAAAGADVLPLVSNLANYETLRQNIVGHLEGVKRAQHESGAWHTVMDDWQTYPEMSATAAFAYAMNKGVQGGWVDPSDRSYAVKAINRLAASIDEDGLVNHGSGGTCVMADSRDYHAIPYTFSYFAQGLTLMALCSELGSDSG